MFGSLSEKITETFKKLKGQGRISETSLNTALREIRIALLEADVALSTTKDFIENTKNSICRKYLFCFKCLLINCF